MEQKSHGISDFEKLYSRYYPKMVRFVTAYVLTRTDAENIVQDIFLDLLEKENVGSINNLNAYLFRMAKNKSVDFLRHRIMREKKEDSIKDSMLREYNTLLYFIEKFDERRFFGRGVERRHSEVDRIPARKMPGDIRPQQTRRDEIRRDR